MIEISRSIVRAFRAVIKKIVIVGGAREAPAVVVFRADRMGLHIQARNSQIAVEHTQPGSYAAEEIAVSAEALGDFESRKDVPVRLQANQSTVVASWQDKVVPQVKQYTTPNTDRVPKMPAFPANMNRQPAALLKALSDASEVAGTDVTRFALTRLQLRGNKGQIVSSDGKQLLAQCGFAFGWDDDVLVPASAVFSCRELHEQEPINLGRSNEYVTLSIGPWTLHLAINKDGKFPNVDTILANNKGTCTTLKFDPTDAQFLVGNLDSLPGARDDDAPVTVEGNGQVIVRSKANDQPTPTEVLLARSQVQGKKIAIATNRNYLAHALRLGFSEVNVYGTDAPAVFRDEKRQYVWQLLGKTGVLAANGEAIRLSSTDAAVFPQPMTTTRNGDSATEVLDEPANNGKALVQEVDAAAASSNGSERNGIAAVLDEADAIKDLLRQAYTRTHQLVSGLKRYRKQAHLVQSSLKAIKQLQLVEA